MACKRVRPDWPVPDASSAGGGGDKLVLRRCIVGFYSTAIERLPVEEKPALLPSILDGGFCFGPLDPVSNIVANAIRHLSTTGEDSGADVDEVEMWQGLKTMAWGSLKALVGVLNFINATEEDKKRRNNIIDLFPDATKRFWADMRSFHRKAKTALESYVLENGGPEYVIHVICGANGSAADRNGPELRKINWPRSPNKFHYSHINFLASLTGSCAAGLLPTLFFAECVNHDEESDRARMNTCCPVVVPPTNAEKVRCFYCEYKGINIIHPPDRNYHGCDTDFEKMARRKYISTNSIEIIFNNGLHVTDSKGPYQMYPGHSKMCYTATSLAKWQC
uniref:Uncharacterized protein n=1 Tax=Oryza punctata TaxID=4537 RepID=A0A0E0M6W2_ORYPU